ncbi:uncharacterized protein LOC144647614 [Oculina patagonica]
MKFLFCPNKLTGSNKGESPTLFTSKGFVAELLKRWLQRKEGHQWKAGLTRRYRNPREKWPKGPKGTKGEKGGKGAIGPVGKKGSAGIPGSAGTPGRAGIPGTSGPRGPKGLKGESSIGAKGEKGRKGEIGPVGAKGSKGYPGSAGIGGYNGARGPKGSKGESSIGTKGEKGDAANIDPRQLANWKQCAWSARSDTDNGKIKECSFNKLHSNTALKVSYQGNIRVYTDAACNRWHFKFNGNECSGPMTIDSVTYTYFNGHRPNVHRNHFFEGYCENLARGTVRVELWVGKCSGYKQGDAYTGWNSVSRIMIEEVPPSQ